MQDEVVVAPRHGERVELDRAEASERCPHAVEADGQRAGRREEVPPHEESARRGRADGEGSMALEIRGCEPSDGALGHAARPPRAEADLAYTRAGMATTRDYYDILGLERGASDDEIKRSFRRLAQQWHPDVSTDPDADARFKEINEAYQVLSDPQRRQAYDLFGRAGVGGTGAGAEGYGPFGGFQGFGDIFDAFFGGATAGGATRRARRPAGADLRYDLELTFEEAIHGARRRSSPSRALDGCATCGGSGAREGTTPRTCPPAAAAARSARCAPPCSARWST